MAQVNRISTRIVQANAYIQLKELRSNSRLGGLTGDFSNTSAIYQATRLLILSHVVFSACSLEESAICVRSSALEASKRVLFTIASRSSGGVKNPVLPSMTISLGPPASRATTGSPQAIASRTTSPNVSVTEQCTNRSALAYARARLSPSKNPVNSTLSPTGANADRTSSSTLGFLFPPTISSLNASPRSTNALATRAKKGKPFSGANRPTQQSTIS